ncbi:hypothetical protein B0T21DRAFT_138071 [Apiosordaria backusii]|uniref:Uncharacterized protein n=1 Tax=Apiosordaria backusii TaxID=314023 RepID=A0AA40BRX2_9PEZI|nr:hypothetical protein B0T21DRAFT_138071 [Apiosordaria backusii]
MEQTPDPIRITGVYEHALNGLAARSLDYWVVPGAIDPAGPHIISTSLASILLGIDPKILEARAKHEECFLHLDWRYETHYPNFTTRHLLVLGSSPIVGFADGTAWAENAVKISNFRGAQQTMPIPDYLLNPAWNTPQGLRNPAWNTPQELRKSSLITRTQTESPPDPRNSWQEPSRWTQALSPPELPDTPLTGSPGPEEDQISTYSDPASIGSTFLQTTAPSLLTPAPFRQNSSYLPDINGDWMDLRTQQQFQSDAFQQQKEQALDLYARTGDVSGMVAVMKTANQFAQGGPSFGPF